VNPALAMAGNFMSIIQERLNNVRVSGHRHGYPENSQRQLALPELLQNAPDTDTGSIFIEGFHAHVPIPVGFGPYDVREEGLRVFITMKHTVFTAFFVIQYKLDRNPGISRPVGMGRMFTVAHHVSGV